MSQRSDQTTAYVSYRRVLEKDSTEPPLPDPYSTELLLPHVGLRQPSIPAFWGYITRQGQPCHLLTSRTSVSLTISVPHVEPSPAQVLPRQRQGSYGNTTPSQVLPFNYVACSPIPPTKVHCTATLRMSPSKRSTNNFRPCVCMYLCVCIQHIYIYIFSLIITSMDKCN